MNALKKRPGVLNPTVTVTMVSEMLGYKQIKSVYNLVKKGLLIPCVIDSSGYGWRRWSPDDKVDYRNHLMFILSEVEQLKEKREQEATQSIAPAPPHNDTPYTDETREQILALAAPLCDDRPGVYLVQLTEPLKGSGIKKSVIRSILFEAGIACYEYTPEQKEIVLQEAELIKDSSGGVSRSTLFELLHTKHNMSNKSYSLYSKMKSILDDYSIPYIGNRRDTGKPPTISK